MLRPSLIAGTIHNPQPEYVPQPTVPHPPPPVLAKSPSTVQSGFTSEVPRYRYVSVNIGEGKRRGWIEPDFEANDEDTLRIILYTESPCNAPSQPDGECIDQKLETPENGSDCPE